MFVPHVADQDCCVLWRQELLQTHLAPFTAALERFDARAKIDSHICGAYRPRFERQQEEQKPARGIHARHASTTFGPTLAQSDSATGAGTGRSKLPTASRKFEFVAS